MKYKIPKINLSRNEYLSFIITLVATLIGVFIAIWLTNLGVKIKEKEDTIKLLKTAKIVLVQTGEYSKGITNYIKNLEKDTVKNNLSDIEVTKIQNPIPYPNLFEELLSNELISKNISERTHSSIYNDLINLKKLSSYETSEQYHKQLELIGLSLELEIEFLNGTLKLENLETEFKERQKVIEKKYPSKTAIEVYKE